MHSVQSKKIHDIMKSISLETGETAKIYVENYSGDDITSNIVAQKEHINSNGPTTSRRNGNQEEREWIEADSKSLEFEPLTSLKRKHI